MRGVIEIFLRKPVMSFMIVIALCLLGGVSITRLPVGLLPNLASPGITIITRYPGVASEKIEELLTIPIERTVSDIAGIEKIISTSSEGESRINLIFEHDADIKIKILEASERIHIIRDGFPREVEEPSIVQYDPTDRPVFIVSFSSERYNLKQLREIVDQRIKVRFERIEGVSEVFVGGGFEREIQVLVDPGRLHAHNMSVNPVSQMVAAGNVFMPGGTLRGDIDRQVYLDERYRSVDELRDVMIPAGEKGEQLIKIGQVAHIQDHYRDRDSISRTNGEDRVTIYVQKAGNANTLGITDGCVRVTETLHEFQDIEHYVAYNQGAYIRRSIERVTMACISGAVIAVIVLYVFLRNIPMTIVIGLTIPCSILSSFFLMFLSDLEINVMSLSGLALGAGMLIDNSIVVAEAIESRVRTVETGLFAAVREATDAVRSEIFSATLTTIVVFIPLIFSNPETRRLYESLSLTVVYSLLVSLFFSLTVLPSLTLALIRVGRKLEAARKAGPDAGSLYLFVRRLDALSMSVRSALSYFQRRSFGLFAFVREKIAFGESRHGAHSGVDDGLDNRATRWNRLLEYVRKKVPRREHLSLDRFGKLYRIKSRPVFYNIAYSFGIPILLLALTPLLFRTIRKEYTSPLDSGDIEASVDLETGTHLQRTQEILNEIEVMLSKHPAVAEVNAKVEKWHATLNLKTDPEYRRGRSTEDIIAELRQLTDSIEEAFVYYNVAAETGGSRELDIEFYGDNIPEMKAFAREMSTRIQGRVEGIEQAVLRFRESKADMVLIPRRSKLAMNETTVTEVGSTLRQLLAGAVITKFYDREREVDVRFRAEEEYVDTPDEVRGLMLPLPGRSLPLGSIVNFTEGEGETRIWRKNKRKSVMITLKIRDRSIDEVALDVEELFREVQFPGDTIYAFGDEYRKLKENQRQMLVAIALSILIIYLLLGALFESFSQPLIILITVPLTITGVLFLLALTRMALNMSVYIGLIMLGGIVVNNAILVVSTINQRLRNTQRRKSALIAPLLRSASMRLRPIFMTTLTTICGMLPMVVDYSEGSGLWRPLAITVSFGLTFSLFVSMVMVPFASYLFYRIKTGVDAGGSG